ncbi:hypothetical protein MAUB1S_05180 [Mycolicibacterium aubagnense]
MEANDSTGIVCDTGTGGPGSQTWLGRPADHSPAIGETENQMNATMAAAAASDAAPPGGDPGGLGSPWVGAAIAAIALFGLWRTMRRRRDRPTGETLQSSALGVFGVALALALSGLQSPIVYGGFIVGLVTAFVILVVAVPAARYVDKRSDRHRRRALGLAPRRELLEPTTLTVLWVAAGFTAMLAALVAEAAVGVAVYGSHPPRRMYDLMSIGLLVFMLVFAVAAAYHVKVVQPAKIRAEDERLRELDLARRHSPDWDSSGDQDGSSEY